MTREEAISEISKIIFELGFEDTPSTDKRVDALNMAIKALSIEPCCNCIEFKRYAKEMGFEIEQEPCEDAISRKAVLDGIEELKKSPWATDKRGIGFEYLITEALEVVADLCVKREPPVTPKPKTDVLDKIRAEIIENSIEDYKYHGCGTDELIIETSEVLNILDKYKAESEDKE